MMLISSKVRLWMCVEQLGRRVWGREFLKMLSSPLFQGKEREPLPREEAELSQVTLLFLALSLSSPRQSSRSGMR